MYFGNAFRVQRSGGHLLHGGSNVVVDSTALVGLLLVVVATLLLRRVVAAHLLLLRATTAGTDHIGVRRDAVLALRTPRLTGHGAARHHLLRVHEALLRRGLTGRRRVEHRCAWRVHAGGRRCLLRESWLVVAALVLQLELLTTLLFALRERDVDRFRANHAAVHLSDGARRLFARGKAHEAEAARHTVVAHDAARGDGAKLFELVAQTIVVHRVFQVFHVQVDAFVFADTFEFFLFQLYKKKLTK